ncbi:MAG: TonB-dependent receptor [Pseudomonadota bacterium]
MKCDKTWIAVTCLLLTDTSLANEISPKIYSLSIAPNTLEIVLKKFSLTTQTIFTIDEKLIENKQSPGVYGDYSIPQALSYILTDTGLRAYQDQSGLYLLMASKKLEITDQDIITLDVLQVEANQEDYFTAKSVTSTDKKDIERFQPRDTSEIFNAMPGVHTAQSRQEPGVSINIRGLQDFGRVNAMVDGARQNFQRSGHGSNGSVYIDPNMLSIVNVEKGPASGVGGASVVGGVVNFKTLDVSDLIKSNETFGGRATVSSGTNGYDFIGHVATAGRLGESAAMVFAYSDKSLGDYEKGANGGNSSQSGESYWHGTSQFTGQEQRSILFKAQWTPVEKHQVKFTYLSFYAEFEEGSDTLEVGGLKNTDTLSSDTYSLAYQWLPDHDLFNVASRLYYVQTSNDQFRFETQETDLYGEFDVHYETETFGGSLENTSFWEWKDDSSFLSLNYGVEFYQDWTSPSAEQLTAGEGRASWFSGPTPEGERLVVSGFTQSQWSHDSGIDVSLGLRYDYFNLEGEGEIFVGAIDNPPGVRPTTTELYTNFHLARHQGYFLSQLHIAYQPIESLQLYLQVAEGVRPPAITESLMWGLHVGNTFPFFPNPSLKAEESKNFNIGFNVNIDRILSDSDTFHSKISWYENQLMHFIVQANVMGPAATDSRSLSAAFVNLLDDVTFNGTEWQMEYQWLPFIAKATWTHTRVGLGEGGYDPFPLGSLVGFPPSTFGEPNGGGLLYNLPPKYKGSLSLGLEFLENHLNIGGRLRFEDNDGRGGGSYENAVDWEVYDAWVTFDSFNDKKYRLNFSVDNLTDENYAELTGLSYWIAPGRTYKMSAKIKF